MSPAPSAGRGAPLRVSVVTSAFNEEANLPEWYRRVKAELGRFPEYDHEIIVADNGSTDRTREILRGLAAGDPRFKCIFNARNFGPARSGHNAFLSAGGDAVVGLVSDLQDPPELIGELLGKWREGYHVVCGVRKGNPAGSSLFLSLMRRLYYFLMRKVSDTTQLKNFTGFGLYDRKFMDGVRHYRQAEPYVRGLVPEIGLKWCEVPYEQAPRARGKSSYNFWRYYDYAMTGFVNHTTLPLRLAVFAGFFVAGASFLLGLVYLAYKLLYWDTFQMGMAPLVIGVFFLSAVQLVFIGVIGEYLGAVWAQVQNRPLVIEEERLNFSPPEREDPSGRTSENPNA